MSNKQSESRTPIYFIGALLGLAAGFIGAHMYVQSVEENNAGVRPKLETGDALRLGMTAITVFRQITDLGARRR